MAIFKGLMLLALIVTSCAPPVSINPQFPSCKAAKSGGVTTITCPDGSTSQILDGLQGPQGQSGHSVVVDTVTATDCPTGGNTILIAVDSNNNHILDSLDEDIRSTTICNGANGIDSETSNFTPVAILNPCGPSGIVIDEVFLKLKDGMVIASMSDNENGKNTRFSVIQAGNYMTTDGDRCYFSINSSGDLYNEHH